jgi:hypothetical protein
VITDPRRLLGPRRDDAHRQPTGKGARAKGAPRFRPNEEIIRRRREHVKRLWIATTWSKAAIARAVELLLNQDFPPTAERPGKLPVDRKDVDRDMVAIRQAGQQQYHDKYDTADELIGAIELFVFLEKEALELYLARKSQRQQEPAHRLDRLLRTAREFRRDRLQLMVDFGLMNLDEAEAQSDTAKLGTGDDARKVLERLRAGVAPIRTPYMERWIGVPKAAGE